MKYLVLALVFSAGYLAANLAGSTAAQQQQAVPPPAPKAPANPAIDMSGYLRTAQEAAKHRETHRVTEQEFIKMMGEKGTIVLDARSKEMFDRFHVKGAINLSFPNIDMESLPKLLPDKNARILIYCNNNFTNPAAPGAAGQGNGVNAVAREAMRPKAPAAALNISTFIALYGYGYKNVYELAPLIEPAKSKLEFVANKK
jgi:rhodanese-related sulfurtransferase